jgi:hypothetical protein
LQEKKRKLVNDFPMAFAFSNEQFEEAKVKLGVTDNSELLSTSAGGFIRKTDQIAYTELFQMINTQDTEAMKDDDYMYQGFLSELANHEFCITYDPTDTLKCFGLTVSELNEDERLLTIFKKAKDQYLSNYENY